jgi:hypothetical protein
MLIFANLCFESRVHIKTPFRNRSRYKYLDLLFVKRTADINLFMEPKLNNCLVKQPFKFYFVIILTRCCVAPLFFIKLGLSNLLQLETFQYSL